MKTRKLASKHNCLMTLLFPVVLLALFPGCSSRAVYDTGAAAAGAGIGYMASDGDPLLTVAGAAGGVLISEGIQASVGTAKRNEYSRGYDRAQSDATKSLYWAQQRSKKPDPAATPQTKYSYYEVPSPTTVQTPNGAVNLVESTVAIPVVKGGQP